MGPCGYGIFRREATNETQVRILSAPRFANERRSHVPSRLQGLVSAGNSLPQYVGPVAGTQGMTGFDILRYIQKEAGPETRGHLVNQSVHPRDANATRSDFSLAA